jgi:predicted secreted protein
METMLKTKGNRLLLGREVEGKFRAFGCARSCEVWRQRDVMEVASARYADRKEHVGGRKSWGATCECLVSAGTRDVEELFESGEAVKVVLRSEDLLHRCGGMAVITALTLRAQMREMAMMSVRLQGVGELVDEALEISSCYGSGKWFGRFDWLGGDTWKREYVWK